MKKRKRGAALAYSVGKNASLGTQSPLHISYMFIYFNIFTHYYIHFVLKTSTFEEDEEEGRTWEREGWKDKLLFTDAPKEPMCFW